MFKKFLQGLIFGSGFGIAFVTILIIGIYYIAPTIFRNEFKELEFTNPKEADGVTLQEDQVLKKRNYRFFKGKSTMEIPSGGGILAMTVLPTDKEAERPRTYQIWLTESELWQIRTNSDSPQIEKLPYPKSDPVEFIDKYMDDSIGAFSGISKMTVSMETLSELMHGGDTCRDDHLNGELILTKEGVVFVLPNLFEK